MPLNNFFEICELANFLTDNDCSEEAAAFGEMAAIALANDGEVDWEDKIIYDSTFNNFPCHKQLIKEVNNAAAPLSSLILNTFNTNNNINLVYEVSESITVNANTTPISSFNNTTNTCDIVIKYRKSYLQTGTDLAIAETTLHEGLHAILVYMLEAGLLSATSSDYKDLVEAYLNYLGDLPNNYGAAHHELMTQFVEDIASALSVYGNDQGYNLSYNDYKNLVWAGLMQTPTFQNLYPQYLANGNVNPAWLEINNSFSAEQNNTSYTYNHPNGNTYVFNPKGTPPSSSEPCN